ncbi:PduA protein-like protein [Clostridium tetanomorphum DSM 665]|nr:BMC domain-containing protein [Clostridium tetanomorphum]KAJ52574.1 PduA protein-like protein [Clostridium tetanomorphum DSM 665]NRZ97487.1 microcompartment protein CcmL/EutN [Clostridium tetanomorphum]SQB92383.1 PduA protein-like protein [Clostridium tetanomorphum]
MRKEALGIIETLGYIAAVEALDISLKSANVKFVNCNFVRGGLINITISGDVGAVKAAIDSVTGSLQNSSSLIGTHVIPRPADSVWNMLERTDPKDKSINEDLQNYDNKENENTLEKLEDNKEKNKDIEDNSEKVKEEVEEDKLIEDENKKIEDEKKS